MKTIPFFLFVFLFFVIGCSEYSEAAQWNISSLDQDFSERGKFIKFDNIGIPHVLYLGSDSRLIHAYYSDNQWVKQDINTAIYNPVGLSIISDNTIYAFYSVINESTSNADLYYSVLKDGIWIQKVIVYNISSTESVTSAEIDSQQKIHIAYLKDSSLHYRNGDDSGWQDEIIDQFYGFSSVSITVDSSDTPHIAYGGSYYYNGDQFLKYGHKVSNSWQISQVDSAGSGDCKCAIAKSCIKTDSSNLPHITYEIYNFGSYDINYTQNNGISWESQRIVSKTVDSSNPNRNIISPALGQMVLDSNENPVIVYYTVYVQDGVTQLRSTINYTTQEPQGWSDETLAIGSVRNDYYYPVVSIDPNNEPLVVFSHSITFQPTLEYATRETPVILGPTLTSDFTADVTSGTAPLTVSFTDQSTGSPTGWAWYFGDETNTEAWTQQSASAEWSVRSGQTSVALPDGSIVLMGGSKNDTWRSMDKGSTWMLMNASSGWSARWGSSSVALPDGSIVLTGGSESGGLNNDTWRSMDKGSTWMLMNASSGWSARWGSSSVALPDGSIVLMGGGIGSGLKNDTWRSMDKGTSWKLQTASAGWSAREDYSSVALQDGSIVLMGGRSESGVLNNDTWRSMDKGSTWMLMNASSGWSKRYTHSSVVLPDGSIMLMGGGIGSGFKNDTWRSTDSGATWALVNASSEWSARNSTQSVALPDGSIVLMGGSDSGSLKNDVWRFQPAGSSVQNPSHTYTTPETYQVSFQAYNADGYNSTRKTGYITVTGGPSHVPVPISPGTSISPGHIVPTLTPDFSWQEATGADSYGLYIRDMDTNTLVFDSRLRGITITGTSYTLPAGILQSGTPYRWNMNAHTSAGWGLYSERLYFQTPASPSVLNPPVLNYPGASVSPGPEIATLPPEFNWQPVVGADEYGLYISDVTNGDVSADLIFSSRSRGIQITGTSHTPPSYLFHDGHKYRWNMNSHSSDGWGNTYSELLYFQSPAIDPAQIPVADFTYSPSPQSINGDVKLDASISSNPDLETLTNYAWTIDGAKKDIQDAVYMHKFTTAGDHVVSLVVRDDSRHISQSVTKTITIGDDTSEELSIRIIHSPQKMCNQEIQNIQIQINNLEIPESGIYYYLVKLDLPTDIFFKSSTPANFYYDNDTHTVYWYISNFKEYGTSSSLISLNVQYLCPQNVCDTGPMRMNVSVRKESQIHSFYPGIGWDPLKPGDAKSRETYASALDATFLPTYKETWDKSIIVDGGWLTNNDIQGENFDLNGAMHVWLAYHNRFTDKNYVNVNDPNGKGFHKVVFSHSGGTQTVYKKLEKGVITADYVFFIAPALISQQNLSDLIIQGKVKKKIFVIQSPEDALYKTQIEFIPDYLRDKDIFPAIQFKNAEVATANAVDVIRLEANKKFVWWNCQNLIPDSVDISDIHQETFWIGGASRAQPLMFQDAVNVTNITPRISEIIPHETPNDVHIGLLNWIVNQYNNNAYPFDGTFQDLNGANLTNSQTATILISRSSAHDPNEKTGPEGHYPADESLTYKVEYENEGDGTAFGVYITDVLDPGLDNSTLEISPVFSVATGLEIAGQGIYFPENRTVFWDIGEVPPGEGGYSNITVNFSSSIPDDTKVVNYATVYFPSAFEETKTNAIVTIKGINLPPAVPNLTYPENNQMNLTVNGTLFWKGQEPNNETLLYDVYLGTTTTPMLVFNNTSSESYDYTDLVRDTTYYWRIVAKDPYDAETSSEIHQFSIYSSSQLPEVEFSANSTHGVSPLAVQFYDESNFLDSTSTWKWEFGDGNNTDATVQNPVHTYTTAGTYTVNLMVTNSAGNDTLSMTDYIHVTSGTVSSDMIGIYRDGSWYIDMNGDGVWNAGDQNYGFGAPLWTPVTGDWNHDGKTEIGVYRDGAWYLDYDASGWWSGPDKNFGYGAPGWTPVVGDWNGDGSDKAGAYRDGAWYLDYDGSGTWNAGDKNFAFGGAGWEPVIGKWTADGKSKVGVYKDGVYYIDYTGDNAYGAGDKTIVYGTTGSAAITGDWNANGRTEVGTKTGKSWQLDYDGLGAVNASTKLYSFGAAGWDPVIGNWNGDSPDKIGIYRNGAWYLDYNGNGAWDAGTDKNYAFGTTGWIPVVGRWN